MMIQLPVQHHELLLKLHAKYALTTIVVDKNFRLFSKQLIDKIESEDPEMDAYCKHSHLMELRAHLEHQSSLHGPFKVRISNGKIKTQKLNLL